MHLDRWAGNELAGSCGWLIGLDRGEVVMYHDHIGLAIRLSGVKSDGYDHSIRVQG